MSTSLTTTLLADALREYYTEEEMMRMAYEDHVLLAMMPKDTKWTGNKHIIPIQYSTAQGRSAVFATAQTNTTPGVYDRFELTTSKDYGVIHIDTETILASEGQPVRSYVEARKSEADGVLAALGSNLAMQLYRNGGGARGRRASISSETVTLSEPNDIVNFEIGMKIKASDTDGTSGALRAGTAATIESVNRDDGKFTFVAGGAAAITAFADNDYLFCEGDFGALAKGLDAWLPASAPGATLFFGVNRSLETTRLGGIRYSDSNPLIEKTKRAVARAWREGARVTHQFCNPLDWADYEIALSDRVQYDRVKSADAQFMFQSIKIATPHGVIQLLGDPDCPKGVSYQLRLDSWKFVSRGGAPRVLDADGKGEFLRRGSDDGIEGRFGWFGQLGCHGPGKNVRLALS